MGITQVHGTLKDMYQQLVLNDIICEQCQASEETRTEKDIWIELTQETEQFQTEQDGKAPLEGWCWLRTCWALHEVQVYNTFSSTRAVTLIHAFHAAASWEASIGSVITCWCLGQLWSLRRQYCRARGVWWRWGFISSALAQETACMGSWILLWLLILIRE
jgi:hypothetical protein